MRKLAEKLDVVLPISFFERDGERCFNSLAMIDAGGDLMGIYRKSHIPDFPAYEELFYFQPGDTGFMVFATKFGKVGAGVCWDQWFPETARILALNGAEVLLYPTAIGRPATESDDEFKDSKSHWQQTMQSHAAANMVILAASNRIGMESGGKYQTQFYGSSFIANQFGTKVAEAGEEKSEVIVQSFDLDAIADTRKKWGMFRTRRPDLYDPICNLLPPGYLMDASRQ